MTRAVLLILALISTAVGPVLAQPASFEKPFGMCFDDRGNLYVADIEAKRISVLDRDLKALRQIRSIDGYGDLARPFDVQFRDGRFYVLDSGRSCVLVCDGEWKLVRRIGAADGTPGSKPGEFSEPHAIAVDELGGLFVCDTLNSRIQQFDSDGRFVRSVNGTSVGGAFPINSPAGIALLPNDRMVVAEYGDQPPVIADRSGKVIKTLKSFGAAYTVRADAKRIYITCTYSNCVAIYSHDGDELLTIGNATDSAEPGKLNKPGGAIADGDSNIFVNEWRNKRLQKFSPEGKFLASVGGYDEAQRVDFPSRPRRDSSRPIALSAFTSVLSPEQVRVYRAAGFDKLCIQPAEDLFNPNVKACVEAAHARGMTVELTFDTYFYGAHSEFASVHPEFFTLKRDGTTRNRTVLSYAYPEVRKFKVDALVRAVRESGADGVALDYIRWPAGNTDGYDPPIVEAFRQQHGGNAFDVSPRDPRWAKVRSSFIKQFIRELRDELGKLDRRVPIAVFVDASPDTELIDVGRDWGHWASEGLIDRVSQMLYTNDLKAIYDGVRVGREHAGSKLDVTSCIDVYCGYLYNEQLLAKGALASRLGGADEVMIVRDGAIERLGTLQWLPAVRRALSD